SFDVRDDHGGAAPTMIISEGLARRVWPEESAVGKQVSFWGRDPATVVGVAADVRDEGMTDATTYAFYVPARQMGAQLGSLVVHARGEPGALAPAIRDQVWAVDPDIAVTRMATFDELVSDELLEQRYRARLMVAFGGMAAVFALLGVYGVTARSVARRTREMGIRLALGADRSRVLGLILRQGARLALFGVVLGLAVSASVAPFLEDLLYGVEAGDPATLAGIALAVAGASLLASLAPGRRATRVDPMVALRTE
ncbi:MAG TPA: FtsX-like permease family protein, partial [Longimicrobiales bacterium]|nr:FtsX-like permease family protein [Longimicrobiales bacterium]